MGAKIVGTGYYLPDKVLDNFYFEKLNPLYHYDRNEKRGKKVETSDQWIADRTGIRERRQAAIGEYVHHMGAQAARMALKNAEMNARDLEGIIVASVTQHGTFPSAACKIQKDIMAVNVNLAYDLLAACAGFPFALYNASLHSKVKDGNYLVISVEGLTGITDYTDENSPLFGDGAGAAIISPTKEEKGIMAFYSKSEPLDGKDKWIFQGEKGILRMPDGPRVLKDAINSMARATREIMKQCSWSNDDIRLLIPHQANLRIIYGVGEKLKLPQEKVFKNIEKYGNMSSATCAIGLAEAIEDGRIREGDKVIITGYGSGLVTSAVGIQF